MGVIDAKVEYSEEFKNLVVRAFDFLAYTQLDSSLVLGISGNWEHTCELLGPMQKKCQLDPVVRARTEKKLMLIGVPHPG